MKYTHKSEGGILARCICEDALHNGVHKKVWLVKMPDSENELLDYSDAYNVSYCFKRTFVEHSKWDDVKVDTPIWVYMQNQPPMKRHFAKAMQNGEACYFVSGKTSHSSNPEDTLNQPSEAFVSLTPVATKDLPWNK